MHALISGAYKRAEAILNEHRDQLDALADLLIAREKLDDQEFECFMTGRALPEKPQINNDEPQRGEADAQSEEPAANDAEEPSVEEQE